MSLTNFFEESVCQQLSIVLVTVHLHQGWETLWKSGGEKSQATLRNFELGTLLSSWNRLMGKIRLASQGKPKEKLREKGKRA